MAPGPGSRVPMTAETSPAVQTPGAIGALQDAPAPGARVARRLEGGTRGVVTVGVPRVVLADRVHEARDVVVGDAPGELGAVADRDRIDGESDHARSDRPGVPSSRLRTRSSLSSSVSIFSSTWARWRARAVTWVREGIPRPDSETSICCSAAFFAGPDAFRKPSSCLPMALANASVPIACSSTRDHAAIHWARNGFHCAIRSGDGAVPGVMTLDHAAMP